MRGVHIHEKFMYSLFEFSISLQLQQQVGDLGKEKVILEEANEKLVSSAFDMEREREWRQRENALKVQIAQLEATLKADVGEKGSILDRLQNERGELKYTPKYNKPHLICS